MNDPEAEFQMRLDSPFTMKYYNKERQAAEEARLKSAFDEFVAHEKANLTPDEEVDQSLLESNILSWKSNFNF